MWVYLKDGWDESRLKRLEVCPVVFVDVVVEAATEGWRVGGIVCRNEL